MFKYDIPNLTDLYSNIPKDMTLKSHHNVIDVKPFCSRPGLGTLGLASP